MADAWMDMCPMCLEAVLATKSLDEQMTSTQVQSKSSSSAMGCERCAINKVRPYELLCLWLLGGLLGTMCFWQLAPCPRSHSASPSSVDI